jgi:hypothetical protein
MRKKDKTKKVVEGKKKRTSIRKYEKPKCGGKDRKKVIDGNKEKNKRTEGNEREVAGDEKRRAKDIRRSLCGEEEEN